MFRKNAKNVHISITKYLIPLQIWKFVKISNLLVVVREKLSLTRVRCELGLSLTR